MRGLWTFLSVCLFASPGTGTVTFWLVDNGDLTANLVMVSDGDDADAKGSRVAGVALNLEVVSGPGIIQEVYNYKADGESRAGSKGYGIFPGTILIEPDGSGIIEPGGPVAPATAPDSPPQLPGTTCVLEFAALYERAKPEEVPGTETVLCTVAFSKHYGKVRLSANALRGGVVLTGGGAPSGTNLPAEFGDYGFDFCRECPCFEYGDSNCDCKITFDDVQALITAWPPNSYSPCADFDMSGDITFNDVQTLIMHWPPNVGCPPECVPW